MTASHVQTFFIEEITEKKCPKKDLNMPKKTYSRYFYQSVILLPIDQLWKNNPKRVLICLSGELSTLQKFRSLISNILDISTLAQIIQFIFWVAKSKISYL